MTAIRLLNNGESLLKGDKISTDVDDGSVKNLHGCLENLDLENTHPQTSKTLTSKAQTGKALKQKCSQWQPKDCHVLADKVCRARSSYQLWSKFYRRLCSQPYNCKYKIRLYCGNRRWRHRCWETPCIRRHLRLIK